MNARQVVSIALLGVVCLVGFIIFKKMIKLAFVAILAVAVIGIGYKAFRRL